MRPNRFVRFGSASAAALLLLSSGNAMAQFSTLEDGNSLVHFDTANAGNRVGMDRWAVDGADMLYNQWFWFRTGTSGPERRINSLPETFRQTFNTNADPRDDTLTIRYTSANAFEIEATWRLQGGGLLSGVSDVAEQIRVSNLGTAPINMHFFQYSDFDLNNDILDDFAQIQNAPRYNTAIQSDGLSAIAETVATPDPTRFEVNSYPNTISSLDDLLPTLLNNNPGPLGPGRVDYTWAFQWDFTLAPVGQAGSSFIISKDKHLVPEPGALGLLGLGGLVALRRRRRA